MGERARGQWDPFPSDIIQDHCHSLYKPNSFFVVGTEGERGRESRFRGHFVFGFTYWRPGSVASCKLNL